MIENGSALAITMGEPAGIGGELTLKAWLARRRQGGRPFFALDDPQRLAAIALSSGSTMILGQVNNFNTDALTVGGRRSSSAKLTFGAAPGLFTLRGSAGGSTPTPVFSVGDASANWDGYATAFLGTSGSASSAVADFSGGTVDILADSIFLGRAASAAALATASGSGVGTLILNSGTVTATNLYLGYKPTAANNTGGQGTLNLTGNAVMNVVKDVSLVYRTNGTAFLSESQINVSNNAVLNIGGNLTTVNVGGWTPASINLGGGTINMTGGGIVSVPTLRGAGYLTNASSITITNVFSVGSDSTADTLNVGNNLTLGAFIKPIFNLGADTTVGGGVNDYLAVANNITFNNNPITLTFGAPLVAGTYKLIGYGGTQSGSVTWVNPTRLPIGLIQGGGQVAIMVTNATPATLTWQGTGSTASWDAATANWNGNTEKFYTMDNVVFDDTGVATAITIVGTNAPSSITFNNSALDYTVTASSPNKIDGFTGLTKNGTGLVNMGGGGNSLTFTGPINLNAGTIRVGAFNTGVFGTATATTPFTIAAGATLDIYGNSIGSSGYGRPYVIAGNGVDGNGAIVHLNAAGSANPTITTPSVTLSADASIGVVAAKALNLSGVSAPYNGVLNLAGHTLSTSGGGEARIVQMVLTSGGTINVGGAVLAVRNSIIDGTGPINLGNNILSLGGNSAFTTGYVAKAISVGNGSIIAPNANAFNIPLSSPITIANGGALNVTNSQIILASGVISGNGGLNKFGNSNLVLSAANNYTGPTVVGAGRLVLTPGGSLASPSITVNSGAGFDSTALPGGYTVAPGQNLALIGNAYGDLTVGANGTLSGSGAIAGSVTVATGGKLASGTPIAPGTLTIGTNLTLTGGTSVFKLGATTNPGGGVNDLVSVNGDLDFAAPMTIKIEPVATLSGTYTLFQYSGSLLGNTGNITVTSDARYAYTLDASTPGVITVTISGGAGDLTWRGGASGSPTAWDVVTTTNWLNGGNSDYFYQGDSVTFDDSANTSQVTVTTTVKPAAITLNNASSAYTFKGPGAIFAGSLTMSGGGSASIENSANNTLTGAGLVLNSGTLSFNQPTNATLISKVSGYAGLAKTGTNTLTLVSADSTGFYGTVGVNAGTLRSGSSNALGYSSVTISSGATLDINGQVGASASLAAGGAGVNGLGAINNTGALQTNAVNNLTLNDNATLGAASNRWDVVGILTGNGYDLTKAGASDLWIKSGADTGLGQIDIQSGQLVFALAGTDLGDPTKPVTVRTNASLAFAYDIAAGAKPVTVKNGGDIRAYVNQSVFPSVGASNTFAGDITFDSTGVIRVANGAGLTLSGSLSGPAGLLNADLGSLTLSGSNAYSGDLTVNYGLVTIASSQALPASTTATLDCIPPNSGVWLYLSGDIITPAGVPVNMSTYRLATGPKTPHLSGQGTWAGPINITGVQSGSTLLPQVYFEGVTNLVVQGPVAQSGTPIDVQIAGFPGTVDFKSPLQFSGTMRMGSQGLGIDPILTQWYTTLRLDSSNNSFTNMLFWRGKIIIGADNAIPLSCPITTSAIRTDNDARGWFDLDGHIQTFANFPGLAPQFGGPAMPIWFGNDSTTSDATIVFNSTITNTWLCWIVDNYDTNNVTPHKTGLSVTSGYLRLGPWGWSEFAWFDPSSIIAATNNAYTGPTLVSGGTLQVDNALGNTPVTVSGSGTLAGVGPFSGPVTVNPGAIVSPGGTAAYASSIGTMTVSNNVTLGGTCVMEVNLTAGTYDQVVGVNHLTYGGTIVVTNVGAQAFADGTILPLFSAVSYTPGTVEVEPSPGFGLRWDTSYLAVDGTLRVTTVSTTPVPIGATVANGGSTLDMSWPSDHIGWRLQMQTNDLSVGLNSVWYDVPGSTITNQVSLPIVKNIPTVFYRLVHP